MLNNGVSRANTLNCSIPRQKISFSLLWKLKEISQYHTLLLTTDCLNVFQHWDWDQIREQEVPWVSSGPVTGISSSTITLSSRSSLPDSFWPHQIKNTFNIFGQCWVPGLWGWGMGRGGDRDTVDIRHHNTRLPCLESGLSFPFIFPFVLLRERGGSIETLSRPHKCWGHLA